MAHAAAIGLGVADEFGGLQRFAPTGGIENVDDFERPAGDHGWRRAHHELLTLAAKRAGLDFEEGRWLLRAFRTGVHRELGYGSFNEYAERLFGYSARLTQEKLRVAETLEDLPQTARELESARITFSTARELTRVAVPATEREWLDAARGRTAREVEALVSGHPPGSRPGDAADPGAKRHVLRFEVSGETLATFREAMAEIRRAAGEALDDDAAIFQLCRGVLAGARDEGRSSYQVALTVCEHCGVGRQQGRGELVAVSPAVVAMAECDGQHMGHIESNDERHSRYVAKTERHSQHVHGGRIEPSSNVHGAHVGEPQRRIQNVGYDSPNDDSHAGKTEIASTAKLSFRAAQTVPPALRRKVLRRDSGRCRVPGCRHATFVDVHHLRPRSEGGSNIVANLVTLCGAHHRAIHAGKLLCAGTPSQGLTFRHADGTLYGDSPAANGVEARAKAYRALVRLGFRESEAKRALARVPADSSATVEVLVRAALCELAPHPADEVAPPRP